jgi:hypothetical protein
MLFGSQAPKIIFDPAGENTTILLDYVVVLKDEPEDEILIHQSKFNGHREIELLGKYWTYTCKIHINKYSFAVNGLTPMEKYLQLREAEGKVFRFYRHRDGDYLKDSAEAEVEMFLRSVSEGYYKTTDYKDLLILEFKSTKYVTLESSYFEEALPEEG